MGFDAAPQVHERRRSLRRANTEALLLPNSGSGGSGGASVVRLHAEWVHAQVPSKPSASGLGPQPRRQAVLAESEFETRASAALLDPTARGAEPAEGVTREDAEWVLPVLRGHFLFASMPMAQLLRLSRLMEVRECAAGKDLVRQGDANARDFFIVRSGELEVRVTLEPAPPTRPSTTFHAAFHGLQLTFHALPRPFL